jgi:hypothetical protein
MFVDVGRGTTDGVHRFINTDHIQTMVARRSPDGLFLYMTGGHEIYLDAGQSEKLRQAIADYQQDYRFVTEPRAIDADRLRELLEEKFG